MKTCKICGEFLSFDDSHRGTCKDCEVAISKLLIKKAGTALYPKKVRLKY